MRALSQFLLHILWLSPAELAWSQVFSMSDETDRIQKVAHGLSMLMNSRQLMYCLEFKNYLIS
jgi:hypothetical protein